MSTSRRVRVVVLGVLLADVLGATALAAWLVRPAGPAAALAVVAVLALHAVLHALVLRAAVSPWLEDRSRDLLAAALLAATALAWPVLTAAAVPGEEPWAWLAGFSVGALLVLRRWAAAVGALGTIAALVLTGTLGYGGTDAVRDGLVFAALSVATAGGLGCLVVWMLALLVRAEEGQAAQARLAVAEERLRVSRELHDVLGHRLGVLALRAELAGDAESQDLATRTLREVRETVHGYGTVDLAEQLRGAELVLGSAGVEVAVRVAAVTPSAAGSQLLAAAVREAVTNVLRHSEARRCRIELDQDDQRVHLRVTNDGVAPQRSGGADGRGAGSGLAGLVARAQPLGARVTAEPRGEEFHLAVELAR